MKVNIALLIIQVYSMELSLVQKSVSYNNEHIKQESLYGSWDPDA